MYSLDTVNSVALLGKTRTVWSPVGGLLLYLIRNAWYDPPLNPGVQRSVTLSQFFLGHDRPVGASGLPGRKGRNNNHICFYDSNKKVLIIK